MQPKPRRGGKSAKRLISRSEARRRAERHIVRQMFKGATVRDGMEADCKIYNVRRENTWVVYKNPRDGGLRPSDVVVVCKRTGRVLYAGSGVMRGERRAIFCFKQFQKKRAGKCFNIIHPVRRPEMERGWHEEKNGAGSHR